LWTVLEQSFLGRDAMSPAFCAAAGLLFLRSGLQRRGLIGAASVGIGGWLLYEASRLSTPLGERSPAEPVASVPTETAVVDEAIAIDSPPEILYSLCRDLANLRRLAPPLRAVEAIPPRHARWRLGRSQGRAFEWESTFTGDEPGRSISWRTTYERRLTHLGAVRFERARDDRSTLVTVQLEYLPPADPIGAAVVRAIGPSPQRLVRAALRRLKHIAEVDDVANDDRWRTAQPQSPERRTQ